MKGEKLSACPVCHGDRDPRTDDYDSLCFRCRSNPKLCDLLLSGRATDGDIATALEHPTTVPKMAGSLLELQVALWNKSVRKLPLWAEILYLGLEKWKLRFKPTNDLRFPMELLLNWLAEEHGKPAHVALWMQQDEVLQLLRNEVSFAGICRAKRKAAVMNANRSREELR